LSHIDHGQTTKKYSIQADDKPTLRRAEFNLISILHPENHSNIRRNY